MDKNIVSQSKKRRHVILGTVIKVKGRTVGQVIGDEYVKDIKTGHMLTYPPAIANDIQALHDAERAGAVYCVFTNIDTGIVYKTAISKIWDMGWLMNLGWGTQQALTLHNWSQSVDPQIASQTAIEYSDSNSTHDGEDESEPKPLKYKSRATVGNKFEKGKAKQLSLFGGR